MDEMIMKTKYQEVLEKIEAIDYKHKEDSGMVGVLSDNEALSEYKTLREVIIQIPGLSGDEINKLVWIINKKIDRIVHPVHPLYNEDLITNEEEFRAAIQDIHYKHRYDDGMMGTLDENDAIRLYNVLLEVLSKMENLSESVIRSLRDEIKIKIGRVHLVEEEKLNEYNENKIKHEEAFRNAKERFKSLSLFEKIKLYKNKMAPKNQDIEFMSIEEIDELYKGRVK